MKIFNSVIALLLVVAFSSSIVPIDVKSLWNKDFATAQEIVDTYNGIKAKLGKRDKELHILNNCYYVWRSGEYMFKCRGKKEDIAELPKHSEKLELDNDIVTKFMVERDTARFADHYFTLQAMKRGDSFNESRDGITITVFFPIRGWNSNDYQKLHEVFTCKNDALHIAYLKKLKHPLTNSGCNDELYAIRELIEKNVADSELKNEVLDLYDIYKPLMAGSRAPDVAFKDAEGNTYTISDFKGKVLVIDVWATWCKSCLMNMSKFMALKEEYKNNPAVEFVTVSTDSDDVHENWLAAIEKFNMGNMLNLTPDYSAKNNFIGEYRVSSVPRYMIIDKEGYIISVFAPKPDGGMREIIERVLRK